MDLTGTRTIRAPLDRVWAALNDPQTLKACLPGCESIEADGANAYRVVMAAKVGPVSARFNGRIELADVEPMKGYTLRFDGQSGAAGFARGAAAITLAAAESGAATLLAYRANADVGGRIAQVGARVVDGAAAKLTDGFFARFEQSLAPAPQPGEAAASAASPGPMQWTRWIAIAAIAALLAWLYWHRA